MNIRIIEADYSDDRHAADIVFLTNSYAEDRMGGEEPLDEKVLKRLVPGLRESGNAFTYLAYLDGEPAGIATCFVGFSTFDAARVVNVHDLAVVSDARKKGIGERLLQEVQKRARKLGCCRLTIEVLETNPARKLYERFGFENEPPRVWFMTKEFY